MPVSLPMGWLTGSACWQALLLVGLGSKAERKRIMKNAKAYLSQVKDRKDYIKYLEQDIERLNEEATSIRGVSFGRVPTNGINKASAGYEAIIERKAEKEQELETERERLARLLVEADRMIDAIPDIKVRMVLKMFYLEGMTTADISNLIFYSTQHINRLMNKGYRLLESPVEDSKLSA